MKAFLTILVISLLVKGSFFAQNEGNIWYFGQNAGIGFNGGVPVALTNGALSTFEGCATISDSIGNLLFYTDGTTVWNKNHIPMPSGFGLDGDNSSSQSSIIVKKPNSSTIYYIFTIPSVGGTVGLRYSEVDLSLQSGLGDVTLNKNISILSSTREKVTIISHSNNIDFWVLTHLFGSNTFHSYLLTSLGLNMTPIVSNVGQTITQTNTIGYLKASVNGSRIAMANSSTSDVELYNFDNSTGILSNPMNLGVMSGCGTYGVEFSPSGNLLYASCWISGDLFQYNLLAGSLANIINSKLLIGSYNGLGGALQLGPDHKIYYACYQSNTLPIITNPNILGIGCNYDSVGISLNLKQSEHGLPSFYNRVNFNSSFNFTNLCFGDSTNFSLGGTSYINGVTWNFGDVGSGGNNISQLFNPTHLFSDTGNFIVSVIISAGGITDTLIDTLFISHLPFVNLGNDTILCEGEILILDATTSNATYLWQDNSTNPNFIITQQGTYWVQVINNCENSTDTINVNINSLPTINLGNDTTLCQGVILYLDVTATNASYLWQDNSTNPTYNITQQGTYWAEVTVNSCNAIATDSITITIDDCEVILEIPNVFTPNNDGNNDLFIPIKNIGIASMNTRIYNRWGQLIFVSDFLEIGWDCSTSSGALVPNGTYFWTVYYTDINGLENNLKGYVTILK